MALSVALMLTAVLAVAADEPAEAVCEDGKCTVMGAAAEEEEEVGMIQFSKVMPGQSANSSSETSCFPFVHQNYYCITPVSVVANAKVYSYVACDGSSKQLWRQDSTSYGGSGAVKLRNCANTNLCLDVWYGSQQPTNGNWDMDIFDCRDTTNSKQNQRWYVQQSGSSVYLRWYPETVSGSYYATYKSSGVMKVNAWSGGNGNQIWTQSTGPTPTPMPTPSPTSAPSGQGQGEKCGSDGSTGYYWGSCQSGLSCYRPPNSAPGATSKCVKRCGYFGSWGSNVYDSCTYPESCYCRTPTPCNDCFIYCTVGRYCVF